MVKWIKAGELDWADLKAGLQAAQIFVLRGLPLDLDLEVYLSPLGRPLRERRNLGGGAVFEVKVKAREGHFAAYANSPFEFPCHTDCSDYAELPWGLALFCVRPSIEGGETLLCPLDQVLSSLSEPLKTTLGRNSFNFRGHSSPILFPLEDGRLGIRYSRAMLESFGNLSAQERLILDELDAKIAQNQQILRLEAGDLLLLHNMLHLHGRLAFPPQLPRLLQRLRWY